MTKPIYKLILFFALAIAAGCEKDPVTPVTVQEPFAVTVDNRFNALEGQFAAFLSDETGKVTAFNWLPNNNALDLEAADVDNTSRLDLTVVRISVLNAPGTGVSDTTVTLTTYTGLSSGTRVRLNNLDFKQTTDFTVQFKGITSMDSIIVPDALTFDRPRPQNGFRGLFGVVHTGQFWLRVRVNGEKFWRFFKFENVNSDAISVELDAELMPFLLAQPLQLKMPFASPWQYKVDGVIDTAKLDFLALGDLIRAPGGALAVFDLLTIFEPVNNDQVQPPPVPYKGYRLQAKGTGTSGSDLTFSHEAFYDKLPAQLAMPDFNLYATLLSDKRLVGVRCEGAFSLLSLSRSRAAAPALNWEVLLPAGSGIVTNRLPDVPDALGKLFPVLASYKFDNGVRARAERYGNNLPYTTVLTSRLVNTDPLWASRLGMWGIEIAF